MYDGVGVGGGNKSSCVDGAEHGKLSVSDKQWHVLSSTLFQSARLKSKLSRMKDYETRTTSREKSPVGNVYTEYNLRNLSNLAGNCSVHFELVIYSSHNSFFSLELIPYTFPPDAWLIG